MLVRLHFVEVAGDFSDISENPLEHDDSHDKKAAGNKNNYYGNDCKERVVRAHCVRKKFCAKKVTLPVFLILVDAVILTELRHEKH